MRPFRAATKSKRFKRNRIPLQGKGLRVESLESRHLMVANFLAIDPLLSIDPAGYDPNRVLAQFSPTTDVANLIGTAVAGARVARQVSSDNWFEITVGEGQNVGQVLANLQSRADVVAATPDFVIHASLTPNDPSNPSQWSLENNGSTGRADADIDASQAWDYGTSSSVVVAVIDSGVDYNHVDLASNIWTNGGEISGNGIDDDRNGYVDDTRGWNFVSDNNNPMDDNGHGTHVAGTIGAVGNNGIGVTGVAWNVKIMALKFLDSGGSGMLSDAVSAIDYARTNGAKIINASWGGGGFSSALQSAIQRYQNAGGIFVAAAGNEASNNASVPSFPANYALANVLSVAASSQSDTLASFSNYGTNVDIAAPGVSILSTVPGNQYARYSGTSMAAPHVAGALALLWGQAPSRTAAEIIDLVMQNTDNVLRDKTIHGRLNLGKAAAALQAGSPVDTTSPFVVSALWNASATSVSSVDITFSEKMLATSLNASTIQVTGPNGNLTLTSIVPSNTAGTSWRVGFAPQTSLGAYSLTVQSTVTDIVGNRLDQDRDGTAGEATQDLFAATFRLDSAKSYTTNGPTTIQDATNSRAGITSIPIDVADSILIRDLNVNLSIDHTYVSDLRIRLIAPDGTSVPLVNRRGGSRDNIRVLFDDEATQSIATISGNLTGTLKPEGSLQSFDGKNAKGRWILEVTDLARLDIGRFNSVTLQMSTSTSTAQLATNSGVDRPASNANDSIASSAWIEWLERFLRRSR